MQSIGRRWHCVTITLLLLALSLVDGFLFAPSPSRLQQPGHRPRWVARKAKDHTDESVIKREGGGNQAWKERTK